MRTHAGRFDSISLEPVLDSASAARRFVRDRLQAWGADDLVDDTLLAVSELTTNAIIHARSAIVVAITLDEHRLRVEVRDHSARPVLLDSMVASVVDDRIVEPAEIRGDLTDETTTGRGLFIVAAVASAVGEQLDGSGKTVWFEIERDDRSADGAASGPMVVQARALERDEQVVAVKLAGLPTALIVAADEHLDDLLRELPLVRGDGESEAQALLDCAWAVWSGHPALERIADTARLAHSRGRDRVDVALELSVTAADDVEKLHELAIDAQRLCEQGLVLTLPAPQSVVDLWRWLSAELRRQLVDGAAPQLYPA
ncbi:MAG TPA: ATP-binding protein [Acidimicrobiales bacterium]|jgi:anti-sigma regulatory factor (Ser/Thr protein kinase)|nr:ATP-binding protein [Acidimicrobiales bacterium]